MNMLFFCLIILVIGSIVNKLTKVNKAINSFDNSNKDAQIEVGYPGYNSRLLHINSTKEPPIPNHNFTDFELSVFEEEGNDTTNKEIYTVNMFVESHFELHLSLFERELTVDMVNNAYEKVLNEHKANIKNGVPGVFNIEDKKKARDYLIDKLNKESKS